jgi:predicted transposase YbfD/YdcC
VKTIIGILERFEDNRQQGKIDFTLAECLLVVLMATLCGVDTVTDMGLWGEIHLEFLKKYLPYKENKAPSHDTIGRALAVVKPEKFQSLLMVWDSVLEQKEGKRIKKILALDGKTICGNAGRGQEALHIVTAYSREEGVCFGQRSANSKGKEVPMIKELLGMLKLKGHIVTIDAIGTNSAIAALIHEGGGDYVLPVKGNQGTLEQEFGDYFGDKTLREDVEKKGGYKEVTEKFRSQIEKRRYWLTDDIGWFADKDKWPGMKSIGMAKTETTKEGKKKVETRLFISSLSPEDMESFARAVRGHWSVESMHWLLDVLFREDACHVLEKNMAENLNIVRKWALSLLKRWDTGKKHSLRQKRFILSQGREDDWNEIMEI